METHTPVLREEVYGLLTGGRGHSIMIDATIGDGGHAEAFLSRDPDLRLIGVDADPRMIERAAERLARFGERARLEKSRYSAFFRSYGLSDGEPVDLVLFDLGVAMYHFASSGRGFSFLRDEPLDMRIADEPGPTAADLVNTAAPREPERILTRYGEEPRARRIAAALVSYRAHTPIRRSAELAEIVARAVPFLRHHRIHPATRTFQALRIAVNGELQEIAEGLPGALGIMRPGGRMGVISFHSLEDRLVKRFFRDRSGVCTCPPDAPVCTCGRRAELRVITRRPVVPSDEEVQRNPACRSAKLRVAEKLNEEPEAKRCA